MVTPLGQEQCTPLAIRLTLEAGAALEHAARTMLLPSLVTSSRRVSRLGMADPTALTWLDRGGHLKQDWDGIGQHC